MDQFGYVSMSLNSSQTPGFHYILHMCLFNVQRRLVLVLSNYLLHKKNYDEYEQCVGKPIMEQKFGCYSKQPARQK